MSRTEIGRLHMTGHIHSAIVCDSAHCECGDIEDGIGLHYIEHDGSRSGGWVIRFEELEALYLKLKNLREEE